MKNYETVFILNPVLSEDQAKDTVEKFVKVLKKAKADIVNTENWGLKKLAYPIQKKSTGFYALVEFAAAPETVNTLETEFRRDESVMRFSQQCWTSIHCCTTNAEEKANSTKEKDQQVRLNEARRAKANDTNE